MRHDSDGRMAGESFVQATMLERNILGDVGCDRFSAYTCAKLTKDTVPQAPVHIETVPFLSRKRPPGTYRRLLRWRLGSLSC